MHWLRLHNPEDKKQKNFVVLIAFFQRWRDRYQTGIYEAVDQTILRKRVGVATFLYYYFGDFSLYFDSIR